MTELMRGHIQKWIEGRQADAERDAAESHKAAHNSYGAGYDAGYAAALRDVSAEVLSPQS